jgi:flavin reductase (DIM6/NTAB) family NADH-FMN oxidoreductase RutF
VAIDADTFRSVMGRFASGVTVLTACDAEGRDHGMTVSAFCSVSLEPPLVLVCVDHQATLHPILPSVSYFGVNILARDQEAIARRFADRDADRFDGVGYVRGRTGVALLEHVLAQLECRVVDRHAAGDHTIVIGEVETAQAFAERPLLYYRGGYTELES